MRAAYIKNTIVNLMQSSMFFRNRISSYFSNDIVDRSKMIPYIIRDDALNLTFYVDININTSPGREFKVDMGDKSKLNEDDVDFTRLYNSVEKFLEETGLQTPKLLLDDRYEVVCYKENISGDFIPTDKIILDKLIPFTVNNVIHEVVEIETQKSKALYVIYPDVIKEIDEYNTGVMVYLIIRDFITERFSPKDKTTELTKISLNGFYLTYLYLCKIMRVRVLSFNSIKYPYEYIDKMGLLPKIPTKNWLLKDSYGDSLNIKRLKDFSRFYKNKKSFKSVSDNKNIKFLEEEKEIPRDFGAFFDINTPKLTWDNFNALISGEETSLVDNSVEDKEEIFYEGGLYEYESYIIEMEDDLKLSESMILSSDKIRFMGFYYDKVFLSLYGEGLNVIEKQIVSAEVERYFKNTYNYDCEVIFEERKKPYTTYKDDDDDDWMGNNICM